MGHRQSQISYFKCSRQLLPGFILFIVALFSPFITQASDNDVLFTAMFDELNRSITSLQIEEQEKLYYISYRATDAEIAEIKSEFGGLIYSNQYKARDIYIDLRVGDYQFDNSNFMADVSWSRIIEFDHTDLPLDDNYDAIRSAIWLVTDGTYKKALERFSKKKATIQNQQIKDIIPDFSKTPPCTEIEPVVQLNINRTAWERNIIEISKIFKKYPDIQKSLVTFCAKASNQYFLDTEGNRSRRGDLLTYIEVSAKTQSADGDSVKDFIGFYSHTPDNLPDITQIIKAVEAMAETLSLQAGIKKEEGYSGPVLFTGQAAAELFFQILGKGSSDPRRPLYENEMLARVANRENMGILCEKLGKRVMPEFLSAYDDPHLTVWNQIPLVGHFSIDDQGVMAEKVDIVKNGKLENLLMSRVPIKKIGLSNGHGRYRSEERGARTCGMVGNLIIESTQMKGMDELKNMFIKTCKEYGIPYGIIVTRLTPTGPRGIEDIYMSYYMPAPLAGGKSLLSSPLVAYRIDVETGKTELIRGLDFSSITPRILRDIIATGSEEVVYNFLYRDDTGNEYPMSIIAPSVLIEEMELTTKETKPTKLPIISHPYFKKR